MCVQMKGYSSVNEELLWLHLKYSMADFFWYFLQCVGKMKDLIVLLYPTYSEIVSRLRR